MDACDQQQLLGPRDLAVESIFGILDDQDVQDFGTALATVRLRQRIAERLDLQTLLQRQRPWHLLLQSKVRNH